MDQNVIVVSHVATELDADCAIAALSDAGINAAKQYVNAPGGSTLFALPSAMGFGSAEGYDILVAREAESKAREVLVGTGFAVPTDEEAEDSAADSLETSIDSAEHKADLPEQATDEGAPTGKSSALLMILFLVAAALFVIGVDKLIEIIKALF